MTSERGTGGGRRLGLQSRLLLLMLALVLLAQLGTALVVSFSVEASIDRQLADTVRVGERVWERLAAERSQRQLASAAVLADDFGFRAAVTSGDAPTIRSALRNLADRGGATGAVLLDPDGRLLAATRDDLDPASAEAALAPMRVRALEEGAAWGIVALDDGALEVSLVPVFAPDLVGWAATGVAFGREQALEFRALTALDAAFVLDAPGGGRQLLASSLDGFALESLAGRSPGAEPDCCLVAGQGDGEGYAFAAIRPAEDPRLQVLLLASRDAAMAPYARLRWQVLGLSALAAAVALAIAAWIGRGVTRPVAGLARAAARVAGGDYAGTLDEDGPRELAALARAFNGMQRGIAERESRIRHQAEHDPRTGLPNRGRALEALERALVDPAGGVAMLVSYLGFRGISDTFGPAFGDEVLAAFAARLQALVPDASCVASIEGDGFLLVLPGVGTPTGLTRAEALLEALSAPMALGGREVVPEPGIGLLRYPRQGQEPDVVLRRLGLALADAAQSLERIAVYRPGRDESRLRQLELLSALRGALGRGEFSLAYQPKVDHAGRLVHVEALLRWESPTLGRVGPDEFIPLAERSGVIHPITCWVLEEAVRSCRAWEASGVVVGVAVNLSALDLAAPGLAEVLRGLLERHALPPGRLLLEITESAVMQDVEQSLRMLERLRGLGLRLAIDDFGTGQSSLAQLKRLPVHELKIDKGFVMRLDTQADDALIVRSTIDIAHNMGLEVVAEGVESEAGARMLEAFGCDLLQGYWISRPLPGPALLDWALAQPGMAGAGAGLVGEGR